MISTAGSRNICDLRDPAKGVVMFESDQHEFDEGFDELGHVSPPPPFAKAAPAPVPPSGWPQAGTPDSTPPVMSQRRLRRRRPRRLSSG